MLENVKHQRNITELFCERLLRLCQLISDFDFLIWNFPCSLCRCNEIKWYIDSNPYLSILIMVVSDYHVPAVPYETTFLCQMKPVLCNFVITSINWHNTRRLFHGNIRTLHLFTSSQNRFAFPTKQFYEFNL